MKKLLSAAIVAATFAAAPAAKAANVVEVAASAGTFNTLIAAAKAAGLAGALSNTNNITVFAPTDAAFAKLPAGTVDNLLKPENKAQLAAVLSYHVLPRRLTSGMLPHKRIPVRTIKQGGDRTLQVRKNGHGVTVDKARVVKADIRASNGVVHVIDSVLLPSS
ncbi:MAG: fasciclin domain-containing protein [Pseudomonadota bacterium]